jgi:hypothetical protein
VAEGSWQWGVGAGPPSCSHQHTRAAHLPSEQCAVTLTAACRFRARRASRDSGSRSSALALLFLRLLLPAPVALAIDFGVAFAGVLATFLWTGWSYLLELLPRLTFVCIKFDATWTSVDAAADEFETTSAVAKTCESPEWAGPC